MSLLSKQIEDYTCSISKFEPTRNYISLSHCHLPADEILKQYYDGFEDSREIRLRCYKGYQMERDLKERLLSMPGYLFAPHEEISAFDGLVLGHPDLRYNELTGHYPCDGKSVPLDEHLPEKLVPRRVYILRKHLSNEKKWLMVTPRDRQTMEGQRMAKERVPQLEQAIELLSLPPEPPKRQTKINVQQLNLFK